MNIEAISYFSTRELISRLQKVTMLNDKETKPYINAEIQVTDIHTDLMAPAQLYVLKSEFEKVRNLRWAVLENCGVDILRMSDTKMRDGRIVTTGYDRAESIGFIEFTLKEKPDEVITVLPPIIEASVEADKSNANIINDGMHRCFLARVSRIVPVVVKVARIPANLPYYAFPLANGWSDVDMVESINGVFKKYHRFPNGVYQKYYRDFNSAFTNVGGPRGDGTKAKTKK